MSEASSDQSELKTILITGASSGIGWHVARQLAEGGHTVYAAARRLDKLEQLKAFGVHPVRCDVTVEDDVVATVAQVIAAEGRLDVLINNAGYGLFGPVEEIGIDQARRQFEVNLFGLARITQEVLPQMRKQGSGRIINTSSMGGRVYTPLGAWYHATKHALEGWSDCLRIETKGFGIDVVLIEPGGIRTEFNDLVLDTLDTTAVSPYRAQKRAFAKTVGGRVVKTLWTKPERLAPLYVRAVEAHRPKRRYAGGFGAKSGMLARRVLGDGFYELILRFSVR